MNNASIRVAVEDWLAESADGRSSPKARAKWGPIEHWRVGGVTNFSRLFEDRDVFNVDLGGWDVSSARAMDGMFQGCAALSADLSAWQTGAVANMSSMFWGCRAFSADLSAWQTGQVNDMSYMFEGCVMFSADLSGWQTGQVNDMRYMFKGCVAFSADLSGWQTGKVDCMENMFNGCVAFSADLSAWQTGQVENMFCMFHGCVAFCCYLGDWDTGCVVRRGGHGLEEQAWWAQAKADAARAPQYRAGTGAYMRSVEKPRCRDGVQESMHGTTHVARSSEVTAGPVAWASAPARPATAGKRKPGSRTRVSPIVAHAEPGRGRPRGARPSDDHRPRSSWARDAGAAAAAAAGTGPVTPSDRSRVRARHHVDRHTRALTHGARTHVHMHTRTQNRTRGHAHTRARTRTRTRSASGHLDAEARFGACARHDHSCTPAAGAAHRQHGEVGLRNQPQFASEQPDDVAAQSAPRCDDCAAAAAHEEQSCPAAEQPAWQRVGAPASEPPPLLPSRCRRCFSQLQLNSYTPSRLDMNRVSGYICFVRVAKGTIPYFLSGFDILFFFET